MGQPIVQLATSRLTLAHVALFVSQGHGATVDEVLTGHAVCEALQAHTDWPRLLELGAHDAQVIVSNTADRGYQLDALDSPALLGAAAQVPRSFPAKLLVLRAHRQPGTPYARCRRWPMSTGWA